MTQETSQLRPSAKTNWPARCYFGSLVFGVVSTAFCFNTLNSRINDNTAIVLIAILVFGTGRYFLAMVRREQSKTWIGYCIVWLLLVPEWFVGQAVLLAILAAVWS